jgi:hypothetical protein
MSPNLGSKVPWNGNYVFGNNVLTARPEYGSLVAAVIAGWAVTETHLGRVFAYMVGAKHPITMSMYAAIHSFDTQRDLLKVAAEESLSKRNAILFKASLVVLNRAAQERHKFAHWIWGASADPALQALLLVEPKHFWHLSLAQIGHMKRQGKDTLTPLEMAWINATLPKLDPSIIYVYGLKDLEATRDRMEKAFVIADMLRRLVSLKAAQRRSIYQRLYADADIRLVLEKDGKKGLPRTRPIPKEQPKTALRKNAKSV